MDTVRQYAKQLRQTEAGGYLKSLSTKVKQMALNLTDIEVKVEEATNNEPWGPHGSAMAEISEAAYDSEGYRQIMGVIARRLQDTGELWRHVYKSMLLLEYMLKHGPQKVVQELTSNVIVIEKLATFQYKDKNLKDYGENVRHRAKQLSELILDPERVRTERKKAKELKSKYTGVSSDSMRNRTGGSTGLGGASASSRHRDEEDDDDVYSSASTDRGSVGVARDPKEATRARIEAMKQNGDTTTRSGKKLSTMQVDPKVSASLGLMAPTPATSKDDGYGQDGDPDLMGGLDSPEAASAATAANDSWNAFESADGSSKPMAAADDEPASNGDSSWANFESAPASTDSNPVADLFALDTSSSALAPASLPAATASAVDPFGFDTTPTPPSSESAPPPAPVGTGTSSKPALPEDMFLIAPPLAQQVSQMQQPQHAQSLSSSQTLTGAGFGGALMAHGSQPVDPSAAPFGQQPAAAAFGQTQPLSDSLPRTQSSNTDGTVDVRSLGLTGQSQVHVSGSDPFAGLGF